MDLSAIAVGSGGRPVIQILPPFQKDGQWYGALIVNVNGEPIRVVASASEALLKSAYDVASRYVQFGSPVQGEPPPGSLRAKLLELAPYLPISGLTPMQAKCVAVLQRASKGCESCIDAIQTVDSKAKEGDAKFRALRQCFNEVLLQARKRRDLIGQVAGMTPDEFLRFFEKITRV